MHKAEFEYKPSHHEREKASNSYLMSLVAIVAGLPLPIVNLLATFFFWIGNRKGTYFVRWHCVQALLSQVSLLAVNSIAFWWTVSIIFGDTAISSQYIGYAIVILLVNLIEFIATVYTAIQTRKGIHVSWLFYGGLTNKLVKASV